MKQKCSRCSFFFNENSTDYQKRTKNIFNPSPAFCKDCLRLQKAFNPTDKDIKNNEMRVCVKEAKIKMKETVHLITENKFIQKAVEENKIIQRKIVRILNAKARARMRKALVEITQDEKKMIRELYEKCPQGYHVDHIIPLSKGGKHCLANLQYLTATENQSKSNKILIDVLERLLENEKLSIPYLQRKYRLAYEDAAQIMQKIS